MAYNCPELMPIMSAWSSWVPLVFTAVLAVFTYLQHRRLKRLQAQIDQKLLVHRLQFEAEFSCYKEIWKILTDLRMQLHFLRPITDSPDPGLTYDQTIQKRIDSVRDTANSLVTLIEQNRPFYSSIVNSRFNDLTTAIREEILSAVDLSDNLTYWEGKEERFKKIVAAIESASAALACAGLFFNVEIMIFL